MGSIEWDTTIDEGWLEIGASSALSNTLDYALCKIVNRATKTKTNLIHVYPFFHCNVVSILALEAYRSLIRSSDLSKNERVLILTDQKKHRKIFEELAYGNKNLQAFTFHGRIKTTGKIEPLVNEDIISTSKIPDSNYVILFSDTGLLNLNKEELPERIHTVIIDEADLLKPRAIERLIELEFPHLIFITTSPFCKNLPLLRDNFQAVVWSYSDQLLVEELCTIGEQDPNGKINVIAADGDKIQIPFKRFLKDFGQGWQIYDIEDCSVHQQILDCWKEFYELRKKANSLKLHSMGFLIADYFGYLSLIQSYIVSPRDISIYQKETAPNPWVRKRLKTLSNRVKNLSRKANFLKLPEDLKKDWERACKHLEQLHDYRSKNPKEGKFSKLLSLLKKTIKLNKKSLIICRDTMEALVLAKELEKLNIPKGLVNVASQYEASKIQRYYDICLLTFLPEKERIHLTKSPFFDEIWMVLYGPEINGLKIHLNLYDALANLCAIECRSEALRKLNGDTSNILESLGALYGNTDEIDLEECKTIKQIVNCSPEEIDFDKVAKKSGSRGKKSGVIDEALSAADMESIYEGHDTLEDLIDETLKKMTGGKDSVSDYLAAIHSEGEESQKKKPKRKREHFYLLVLFDDLSGIIALNTNRMSRIAKEGTEDVLIEKLRSGDEVIIVDDEVNKSFYDAFIEQAKSKEGMRENVRFSQIWIELLQKEMDKNDDSFVEASKKIVKHGPKISSQSVRLWYYGVIIAPDKEEHIKAIGLAYDIPLLIKNYKIIYDAAEEIRSLHRVAGRKINRLKASIAYKAVSSEELDFIDKESGLTAKEIADRVSFKTIKEIAEVEPRDESVVGEAMDISMLLPLIKKT